jgi:hypothetical protein
MPNWTCPACQRVFSRANQPHSCEAVEREDILKGRPPELAALFAELERFANSLGPIEIVTRDRYALFRTTRIFADANVMKDCLRLAIHLPRCAEHPLFFKVAEDGRHVSHVAKLRSPADLLAMRKFVEEAYRHSLR